MKHAHVAAIHVPFSQRPSYITLPLDITTEDGQKICQQVMIDLGYFWVGQSVEYLALYTRDWFSKDWDSKLWNKGRRAVRPERAPQENFDTVIEELEHEESEDEEPPEDEQEVDTDEQDEGLNFAAEETEESETAGWGYIQWDGEGESTTPADLATESEP